MAVRAARTSLRASGLLADAVDSLVLVTESFWDGAQPAPHLAFRDALLTGLVIDLGLRKAAVHATWGAACGNLAPALRLASALLRAGEAETVLLVTADRLAPAAPRTLPSGSAVMSDVAAACVLDRGGFGLRLGRVVLQPAPEVLAPRVSGNFVLHARELGRAIGSLDQHLAAVEGCRLAEFDAVVVESLSEGVLQFFCAQAGVARDRVITPGRSRYGHAYSADLLLSLRGLPMERDRLRRIAAVSLSSWTLSATVFEVEPAPAVEPGRLITARDVHEH